MTTKYDDGVSLEQRLDTALVDRDVLLEQRDDLLAALRDCKSAIHHFLKADDQATQDHIMDLATACAAARAAIAKATKE